MQARSTRATRAYSAEADVAAFANRSALTPTRLDPSLVDNHAVKSASERLAKVPELAPEQLPRLSASALSSNAGTDAAATGLSNERILCFVGNRIFSGLPCASILAINPVLNVAP